MNKKSIFYILDSGKKALFVFGDSFTHSWHSLNPLYEVVTSILNQFLYESLLAAFPSLCDPTHPKPSQLGLCQVIVKGQVISLS